MWKWKWFNIRNNILENLINWNKNPKILEIILKFTTLDISLTSNPIVIRNKKIYQLLDTKPIVNHKNSTIINIENIVKMLYSSVVLKSFLFISLPVTFWYVKIQCLIFENLKKFIRFEKEQISIKSPIK